MNRKRNMFTPNQKKVITEFYEDKVRADHYNGRNGIRCLSANLFYINGRCLDEPNIMTEKNIWDMNFLLNALSIPPSSMSIYDDYIKVDWIPNGFLTLYSKDAYLQLVFEFVNYLETLHFMEFNINTKMFQDMPLRENEHTKKLRKIYSPCFTNENFGGNRNDIIDISYCTN